MPPHMSKIPSSRVKAVIDLVDKNELKQALKQVKQMLDKQPNDLFGKTLKAFVLLKSDKSDEALEIAREVKQAGSLDLQVMEMLMSVFREANQEKESIEVCENAWKLNPENTDYGVEVFAAVIRSHDYIKAQQIATKLWKQTNNRKYYFWACVSLSLQVSEVGPSRVLTLAEMMISKMVPDPIGSKGTDTDVNAVKGKVKERPDVNAEELRLLLSVVAQQGAWDRAIDLLRKWTPHRPQSEKLYYERLEAELLWRADRVDEACNIYSGLIHVYPDDWRVLNGWIKTAFGVKWANTKSDVDKKSDLEILCPAFAFAHSHSSNSNSSTLSNDSISNIDVAVDIGLNAAKLEDIESKIKDMQEHCAESGSIRGPFLVELLYLSTVISLLVSRSESASETGAEEIKLVEYRNRLQSSMAIYKNKFGVKESCFSDFEPYINHVDGKALLFVFESESKSENEATSDTEIVDMKHITARVSHMITNLKLRSMLGGDCVNMSVIISAIDNYMAYTNTNANAKLTGLENVFTSYVVQISQLIFQVYSQGEGEDENLLYALLSLLEYDRVLWSTPATDNTGTDADTMNVSTSSDSILDRLSGHHSATLAAIPVYLKLAAYSPCIPLFDQLSVKNVMSEAMLYMLFDASARTAGEEARNHHIECVRLLRALHKENSMQAVRILLQPFDNEAYSRVAEVMAFHERLRRSALLAGSEVEQYLTPLVRGVHSSEKYGSDSSVKRGVGLNRLVAWAGEEKEKENENEKQDERAAEFDYLYKLSRNDDVSVLLPALKNLYLGQGKDNSVNVCPTSLAIGSIEDVHHRIKTRAAMASVLLSMSMSSVNPYSHSGAGAGHGHSISLLFKQAISEAFTATDTHTHTETHGHCHGVNSEKQCLELMASISCVTEWMNIHATAHSELVDGGGSGGGGGGSSVSSSEKSKGKAKGKGKGKGKRKGVAHVEQVQEKEKEKEKEKAVIDVEALEKEIGINATNVIEVLKTTLSDIKNIDSSIIINSSNNNNAYINGWLRKCTAVVECLGFITLLISRWPLMLPKNKSKRGSKAPWKELRGVASECVESMVAVYSRLEGIWKEEECRLQADLEKESDGDGESDELMKRIPVDIHRRVYCSVIKSRLESVSWLRYLAEAKGKVTKSIAL